MYVGILSRCLLWLTVPLHVVAVLFLYSALVLRLPSLCLSRDTRIHCIATYSTTSADTKT